MNYGKCSGCSVHEGFYKAEQGVYSTVYDEVSRLVNEYPSYQIVVTGHSLGAALATLRAAVSSKRDDQQNREISEKSATYFRKVRRGSKSEKPASHLIWYICRSIPFNHA